MVHGRSGREGTGGGSLFLATLLGVGIGLLTAPQPGSQTRKLLLKRLATLSEDVGEGLEDVEKVSSKARKRAKERLAKLRENAEEEWEDVEDRWEKAKGRIRRSRLQRKGSTPARWAPSWQSPQAWRPPIF